MKGSIIWFYEREYNLKWKQNVEAYILILYIQEIEMTHIFIFWRLENIK